MGCDLRWRERASFAGFLFSQGVRVELEHLKAKPVVDCLQRFHDRVEFVNRKHLGSLHDVTEAAGIVRHDAHQLRRYAVDGQHVITRGVFDAGELSFCCYLTERQDL